MYRQYRLEQLKLLKGIIMYLANFEIIEPMMLVSIINIKLRNEFNGDLNKLVKVHSIDRGTLERKLAGSDVAFNAGSGKFM